MDLREVNERRSIAYHAVIAERLLADAEMVARAHARVDEWERSGVMHPRWAAAWRSMLAMPRAELAAAMVADDERMRHLRSTSPFAGELAPGERWALWRAASRSLQ